MMQCSHAKSFKSGMSGVKQRYKCKSCGKRFIPRDPHPLAQGGDGYELLANCTEMEIPVEYIKSDLKKNGLDYSYEIVRRFVKKCKDDLATATMQENDYLNEYDSGSDA